MCGVVLLLQQLQAVEGFVHVVVDDMCGRTSDFVALYARVISDTDTNIHELVNTTKRFLTIHFDATDEEVRPCPNIELERVTGLRCWP